MKRCRCWDSLDGPCERCEAQLLDAREEDRAELAFVAVSEPWSAQEYLAWTIGPQS